MHPLTKIKISKFTLVLLSWVVFCFILALVVIVVCAGLDFNPFRQLTSGLLISGFFGLIGLSAALVLLNVAVNISLIADAKIAAMPNTAETTAMPKRWFIYLFGSAAIILALLIGGNIYSKKKFIGMVHAEADEVMSKNAATLNAIGEKLATVNFSDFADIAAKLDYIQKQRADFPRITLIYFSNTVSGSPAYHQITDYWYQEQGKNRPVYYSCSISVDCEYLQQVFHGNLREPLESYSYSKDDYGIYIPFEAKGAKFVLKFNKYNQYGQMAYQTSSR